MQGCEVGSKMRYWLTLISGMLECLCFAGVVFGYTSLVFVLKEDLYFSELCSNNTASDSSLVETDCRGQDEQFSLVFTIASFLNNFLSLINGYLFDRFGTMVTRLLAVSLYTTGTLFVAFSSAAYSLMLFPALSCIAVGGILLLMTNIQVGNLFAAHRSTIITFYNGAFDSSSGVFLIIKILHERGISLQSSFIALSLCSIILVARTFLLMPRTHIPYPLPPHYTYGFSFGLKLDSMQCVLMPRVTCGQANSYNVEQVKRSKEDASNQDSSGKDETAKSDETDVENTEKVASFRSCALSWFFLWHLVWLSILQLRHYLFIGTLNSRLSRLARNDPTLVSQYTNAFAMTQLCGVLCAPWNGLILDRHKGKPRAPGETEQDADLRSSYLSLFLTSLQCLLFSVCASIPVLPLQYVTFILQVLNRSFLYGGNAAFISIAFPARHFGKLYGLVMSLSAVISLLQYPCFSLVRGPLDGDPFYVSTRYQFTKDERIFGFNVSHRNDASRQNMLHLFQVDITLTLLSVLVFIHPVYVFIHCRRKARSRKNIPPADIDIGPSLAQAKLFGFWITFNSDKSSQKGMAQFVSSEPLWGKETPLMFNKPFSRHHSCPPSAVEMRLWCRNKIASRLSGGMVDLFLFVVLPGPSCAKSWAAFPATAGAAIGSTPSEAPLSALKTDISMSTDSSTELCRLLGVEQNRSPSRNSMPVSPAWQDGSDGSPQSSFSPASLNSSSTISSLKLIGGHSLRRLLRRRISLSDSGDTGGELLFI
ncbi:hypothetical protein CCH79_00018387 [Gambusia affinis]|uniref:Solute carrier family 43 member 3 n=1 Tax=Gambusia affinis TaxID=33528 RepID=A0A315V5E1_GAMAF|nr:hypothetical protein CCH79_00018387 [Gambusia affinis]